MKKCRRDVVQAWSAVVSGMVCAAIVVGLASCSWFEDERQDSPTTPVGSAFELGNYAQQPGQSRVVTVNGAQHQINGVVSGSVVAGGLYIELNEQSSVGSPAGTDQVAVSLQDVTITFTGLPSGVSAIKVFTPGSDFGQYAVSDGSVEIALTYAQWTQWFGPSHYAVVCEAVGSGTLSESMAAVSGRLPSGEVVTFGKGFGSGTGGGGSCPACPACPPGTYNPNGLPVFVNNGNGTITDTRTGLIWLQDGGCGGLGTWTAAGTWAAGLVGNGTMCGLTDGSTAGQWRVPTRQELESILNFGEPNIAAWLNTQGFTNVQLGWHWTSTDFVPALNYVWLVRLVDGAVNGDGKSGPRYAWAVR